MRNQALCLLLLASLVLFAAALSGCSTTGVLPPATTSNFVFVRATGAAAAAQTAKIGPAFRKDARESHVWQRWSRLAQEIEPGDELYLMDHRGALGSETPVGEPGYFQSAFLSSDGTRIVFPAQDTSGHSQVFIANADGTGVTQLTSGPGDYGEVQLSPDGTQVVFAQWLDGPDAIYVIPAAGGTAALVPTAGLYLDHPTFAPSGKILFEGWDDATTDSIWVVDQNGDHLTNLTNNPATESYDETVSVSPDGSRIVFSTYNWVDDVEDIYIADFSGTAISNLAKLTTTGSVAGTSWDPMFVADRIVFLSWGDTAPPGAGDFEEIYSMNYDGSGVQRLTQNTDWEWFYD